MSKPIIVKKVSIIGNNRTKLSFFDNEINDTLNVSSVDELTKSIHLLHNSLMTKELFDTVDINLNEIKKNNDDDSNNIPIEINIKVTEKGIPFLRMESSVKQHNGTNSVGFEVQGALRSPLGYGESLRVSVGQSSNGSRETLILANIPNVTDHRLNTNIIAQSKEEDHSYFLSFKQKLHSIATDFETKNKAHKIVCEVAIRDEIPIPNSKAAHAKDISVQLMRSLISSTKVCTKYIYTYDNRDNGASPASGNFLQSTTELALPTGSAQFVKTELMTQIHRTLGPGIFGQPGLVASLCGNLGLLIPLKVFGCEPTSSTGYLANGKIPHMSDRFFLGGPLSLRGFHNYGVGKRVSPIAGGSQHGDPLGGISKSSLLLLLSVPIPIASFAQNSGRAFMFFSSGSIGSPYYWATSHKNIEKSSIFGSPRLSVGGGLSFAYGSSARIEGTYTIPILKGNNDVVKPFQLGVSLSIN